MALYLGGAALPAGVSSETLSPDALSRLSARHTTPLSMRTPTSSEIVFLAAAPVAAFAFLISWLLPELKLRNTLAAGDQDAARLRHDDVLPEAA